MSFFSVNRSVVEDQYMYIYNGTLSPVPDSVKNLINRQLKIKLKILFFFFFPVELQAERVRPDNGRDSRPGRIHRK